MILDNINDNHKYQNSLKNVHNIQQLYKQISIDTKIPFNLQIYDGLKNQDLFLNLNKIFKADIQIFQFLLQNIQFQNIQLNGCKFTKEQLKKSKMNKIHLLLNYSDDIQNRKEIYSDLQNFQLISMSIGANICISKDLQQLSLNHIKLNKYCLQNIGQNFQNSLSLRELQIRYCDITDELLIHLSDGIQQNQSIVLLDLSYNKLSTDSGYQLGKILSSHCQRRNDIIWNIKLRDEQFEEDLALMGICDINVQGNLLNFKAIKEFCFFLRQDNWTRCINLSENKIDDQGIQEISMMLKENKQIISIDLRKNEGFTQENACKIVKQLLNNIKQIKKPSENSSLDQNHEKIDNQQVKIDILNDVLIQSGLNQEQLLQILEDEKNCLQIKYEKCKNKKKKKNILKKISDYQTLQDNMQIEQD